MVDVAQLVEPRIVIPVVVGSIPIVHPSFLIIVQCIFNFRESNHVNSLFVQVTCPDPGLIKVAGFLALSILKQC